ncbi:MAG: AP endonuclease [Alphaproteobacteria bacterium]|nr:AP endonuclease [Alphaproteobacteria bacterium]
MRRLGLKLWSINTDNYYKEAKKLYNNGIYDYIELYIVPNTINTLDKWTKLEIPYIIHAPHSAHGFNLALKEKQKSNFEIYKQVKQFADELNAEYIIFHGGIEGNINETANQLASFNEARALIENKPLMGLPGNLGSLPCRGYNIEEIKTVIDKAKCGFCFDFGHCICSANAQNKEPYAYCEDFIKELAPNMYHLTDLKDITSIYDSHLHLGNGELDLNKIIAMIQDNKNITLETVKTSKENIDDFIEDIKRFRVENAKNYYKGDTTLKDKFNNMNK